MDNYYNYVEYTFTNYKHPTDVQLRRNVVVKFTIVYIDYAQDIILDQNSIPE